MFILAGSLLSLFLFLSEAITFLFAGNKRTDLLHLSFPISNQSFIYYRFSYGK